MASTYVLPIAPTSHAHSHGRSRSHYTSEPSPYSSSPIAGNSPAKEYGHRNYRSDMNSNSSGQLGGAVPTPYTEYSGHTHDLGHGHERSLSNESAYTLKPFMNGRSIGRARGESELGLSPLRNSASSKKYGFSPIQETPPAPPPLSSS